MWVKICGVTCVEDAEACVAAGADAIGFNFWPRSKRFVPPDAARAIAEQVAGRIERFGVFVDPTAAELDAAFAAGTIDVAQLHGDEEGALCARYAGRYVKAVRLAGSHSIDLLDRYDCERFLVDAPFAGYGGSGLLVDLDLARAAVAHPRGGRIILAGGLSPENVGELAASVRPWGVDVATGVERRPGVKDHEKVRRFVAVAKERTA